MIEGLIPCANRMILATYAKERYAFDRLEKFLKGSVSLRFVVEGVTSVLICFFSNRISKICVDRGQQLVGSRSQVGPCHHKSLFCKSIEEHPRVAMSAGLSDEFTWHQLDVPTLSTM